MHEREVLTLRLLEVATLPMGAKAEAPMNDARRTMVRNMVAILCAEGRRLAERGYKFIGACMLQRRRYLVQLGPSLLHRYWRVLAAK
jgi:hypothetical protein